jgi:hypothetical protein
VADKQKPGHPPPERRCKATSKRRKQRCNGWALPGAEYCHYHGGKVQARAREAERNGEAITPKEVGGAPRKNGLYAKRIVDSVVDVYHAAAEEAGRLDEELRVARANLAWALEQQKAKPNGGAPVNVSRKQDGSVEITRIRPWFDIVREHTETIRRLEEAKSKIESSGIGGDADEDMEAYEAWLARQSSS